MNLRFVLKAVLFGGIIGLLIYINQEYLNVEAEEIQGFLLSFGLLAPVAFVFALGALAQAQTLKKEVEGLKAKILELEKKGSS